MSENIMSIFFTIFECCQICLSVLLGDTRYIVYIIIPAFYILSLLHFISYNLNLLKFWKLNYIQWCKILLSLILPTCGSSSFHHLVHLVWYKINVDFPSPGSLCVIQHQCCLSIILFTSYDTTSMLTFHPLVHLVWYNINVDFPSLSSPCVIQHQWGFLGFFSLSYILFNQYNINHININNH